MAEQNRTEGSLALRGRARQVITIAASKQETEKKLRVAGYARVSSDSEDQLNSYAAQTRYFTTLISSNEKWELADVYADEGATGTSAEQREEFQRLLADCRRGRVDRIITKSVSRFARNTRECLTAIRELKALGVSVCFEEQNIDTGIATGEMLTAVFAGLAQEESQSISRNMRWSYQKRMQSGTYVPCTPPYGYRRVDGKFQLYEPEANIVRRLFAEYLSGVSSDEIAQRLRSEELPGKYGVVEWSPSSVRYILTNEKYVGDALWQKYYTTDTLPYQHLLNRGERDSYYAEDVHEPIISRETYQAAQELLNRRAEKITTERQENEPLRRKIWCGCCGSVYRRKNVNQGIHWVCRGHDTGKSPDCPVTMIPEAEFHTAFLRLFHKLKRQGGPLLQELFSHLTQIRNRRLLWSEDVVALNNRICEIMEQDRQLNELNSLGLADPDFYIQRSNELASQLRDAKLEKERLLETRDDEALRKTRELLEALEAAPEELEEFDGGWFEELVEKVIVDSNERVRFRLKNGLELTEPIERTVR